ncbi:MAG: DUF177 domain-containing protein [Coriobacteriia bacterium]|nr:DUF177 domain-containing protein [Coriobacteriia bacterium]
MVSADKTDSNELKALPQLIFRLLPELADLGDMVTLSGSLEVGQFAKGAMSIRLPEGVNYDIELSNTGGAVLMSGLAEALVVTDCTRCAEETSLFLKAEAEAYYLLDSRDFDITGQDDGVIIVGSDSKVDLAEPIIAALIYELPFVVLCSEDCKGLCDKCYANLNNEECTCVDEPDPDHPFAALRSLLMGTDQSSYENEKT